MGTNFYIKTPYTATQHIGKRSAAGMYCWDCDLTLCKGGNNEIHFSSLASHDKKWHLQCPNCDAKQSEESLTKSSVGRELGFNKSEPKRKSGVASCSSFSWAMEPADYINLTMVKDTFITDEYSHVLSIKDFEDVLKECPIRFYGSIGTEFC